MNLDGPKNVNGHGVGLLEPERHASRPAQESPIAPSSGRRIRPVRAVLLVAAGAALATLLALHFLKAPLATGVLAASGRIEGRITTVTPKSFGRVVEIRTDEGRTVVTDQVLAVLDDEVQRQRIKGAAENLRALEDRLRSVETQLATNTRQVPLQIEQAQDGLRQAEAAFVEAKANAEQARRDGDRAAMLLARELISRQDAESSFLRVSVNDAALTRAEAGRARAEKDLAVARLGLEQLEAQRADRDSLGRQVMQARAALAEQESYVADFTIRSPLNGTVLTRNIELGMRMNVGDTLFTLVDLNQLYLKVYVPEPDIGKIALGQDARVYVDAYPGRPFAARVSKIYPQAEFTPKNVETKEERVKLVFPVELALVDNRDGLLKPGMPADGLIRVVKDAPWPAPTGATRAKLDRFFQRPSGAPGAHGTEAPQ